MRLRAFIKTTQSYPASGRALVESEDDAEYIEAVQAVLIARDMLVAAGSVQIGRSNLSEARYLARPGSTWLRLRIVAHEPVHPTSSENVVASIVFVNRYEDTVTDEDEIDGERVIYGKHRIKHTGLDRDDIGELVHEAIKKYDEARAADRD